MSGKVLSLLAFLGAAVCLVWLVLRDAFWGTGPVTIGIQIAAGALMAWARLTFGGRSFHATADPTAGGLVTRGPYRYLRHPIYAAILYALWAGIVAHLSALHVGVASLISIFLGVRMWAEETLLRQQYPEYVDYARHTTRVVPYVF